VNRGHRFARKFWLLAEQFLRLASPTFQVFSRDNPFQMPRFADRKRLKILLCFRVGAAPPNQMEFLVDRIKCIPGTVLLRGFNLGWSGIINPCSMSRSTAPCLALTTLCLVFGKRTIAIVPHPAYLVCYRSSQSTELLLRLHRTRTGVCQFSFVANEPNTLSSCMILLNQARHSARVLDGSNCLAP